MLVTGATESIKCFPSARRTLFRRHLNLEQVSRYTIIHPMNNEIASVRVQLLLRNVRDLSVNRF
jgi:hypothetical protein